MCIHICTQVLCNKLVIAPTALRGSHQGPYPLQEQQLHQEGDHMSDLLAGLQSRADGTVVTRDDVVLDFQASEPFGTLLYLNLNVTAQIFPTYDIPTTCKDETGKPDGTLETVLKKGLKTGTRPGEEVQFREIVTKEVVRDLHLHWRTMYKKNPMPERIVTALNDAKLVQQFLTDDTAQQERCKFEGEFPVLLVATGDKYCVKTEKRILGVLFVKSLSTLLNACGTFTENWGEQYFECKDMKQNHHAFSK